MEFQRQIAGFFFQAIINGPNAQNSQMELREKIQRPLRIPLKVVCRVIRASHEVVLGVLPGIKEN